MKITMEIKTVKEFELDGDLYHHIKDLEGEDAVDKLVEIFEGYSTDECSDSDKLEVLDNHCNTASWTEEIVSIKHQQTYRVYDFDKYKTLFKGELDECESYISNGNFTDRNVEVVEN